MGIFQAEPKLTEQLKILQVSLKPPYPKVDGGCVAIAAMTESQLLAGHDVKVLTMETHKHPFHSQKVPAQILDATRMEAVHVDTRIRPLDAFLNLFTSESYNIQRFYSKAFETRLIEILKKNEFEIIHLESIFCTPYLKTIRTYSKAKIAVRAHNIEFRIWEQLARQEANPLKKWYLNLLAARLKNYELDLLKKVDGIVAITKDDADELQQLGIHIPVDVVPIGMNVAELEAKSLQSASIHLYHLGAMDWLPNVEGINWFVNDIWPNITANLPDIQCSLAGREMPASLLSRSFGNLTIVGEVSSISEFVSDKNVAIIPLLSGSGLRVKILEALGYGKVVITTSLGATGIPYENGKNMLIADSPDEFVKQIRALKENPELITSIGNEARKLAEREFDLKNLSSKLTYFYANM
ncbi:MAG: glycosyltransferase family 4 protein [Flavobacteriales bacterium]|nr:glycosyltransferase family 4 protein [Flavobacteriales bacterium]MCB9192372.1 glycosyltransferase family 4 protein [Flavobacteriales bacterium]